MQEQQKEAEKTARLQERYRKRQEKEALKREAREKCKQNKKRRVEQKRAVIAAKHGSISSSGTCFTCALKPSI